jgi:hypothetical protein
MENFTVRDLGVSEQKSIQEVEQQLLDQHEEKFSQNIQQEDPIITTEQVEEVGLKDEDVLSYIKNRYNKEVTSIDELFQKREETEELPGDVSAYFKYKKETGRGIEDFVKLNRDYSSMDSDSLLAEYYSQTDEDLDEEDIAYMIEDKFSYDEDLDDPKDIKKKELAKKKELVKAKKYFEDSKEAYKIPVESAGGLVSEDEKETYNAYKKYVQDSQSQQEENYRKSEYFQKKTEELFSDDFKGFDFVIGDKTVKFSPGDVKETKKIQSDVSNFISKYIDANGMISDPVGYHRSLAAAMNPEKMATFFYEQGKAEALLDNARKIKNIDMDTRNVPQSISQSGFKVVATESDSGRGLKIKSNRNI